MTQWQTVESPIPIKVDDTIEALHEGDVVFPLGRATKDNYKSQFFPHHMNIFVKSRPHATAHSSGLVACVPAHSCGLAVGVNFITLVKFCINICGLYASYS